VSHTHRFDDPPFARRGRAAPTVALLFACQLALAACGDAGSPVAPQKAQRAAAELTSEQPTIPIYGMGALRRATPQSPCAGGAYRQFDFWVGDWNVYGPAGGLAAGSHVVTDLDGCAVVENWMPVSGRRGRSLSSWDAESGVWRQTWVPEQFPFPSRPIRMAGGLRPDGVMVMDGVSIFRATGWPFIDHYTWTRVDADHVIQANTFDIPPIGLHLGGQLHYTRTTTLPASSSPGTTACQTGGAAGETRNMDFTVGRWRVAAANGLALGTSDITIDPNLSGCLIEERFTTPGGYAAIGWLYYDPLEDAYYRTWVDSEGDRVELRGTFEGGALVLEGTEPVPGAAGARVRMTWSVAAPGELRQVWSVSADGESWREVQRVVLIGQ
jgi:hypothetical protein